MTKFNFFSSFSSLTIIGKIWKHLSLRRKLQLILVFILMLIGGLSEAISLGLVVPFLAAMVNPSMVLDQAMAGKVISGAISLGERLGGPLLVFFHDLQRTEPLKLLASFFIMAAVFSGAMRLIFLWASLRFSAAVGTDLGFAVYRNTLYQPYTVHIARNSSSLVSNLTSKITHTTISISSFLMVISSCVFIIFIIGALFAVNPQVTIIAGLVLGSCYGLMTFVFNRELLKNSLVISGENDLIVKALQESQGGIRDILLDGSQEIYAEIFRKADLLLRRASANVVIIGHSPRFIMESLAMIVFAVLALKFSGVPFGIVSALPILGGLALGAQRLLPALQQGYVAWSTILAYQSSNSEVVKLLQQQVPPWADTPSTKPLAFKEKIEFKSVRFRYTEKTKWLFDGLSFCIAKGTRVGFMGKTGAGKSTCLDLLMGLLEPNQGEILVDRQPLTQANLRAWQQNIAHVPQAIFLSDTTLAENIAFGVPASRIDMPRVQRAAQLAQIADFIESSPRGYQAFVGERGIRLSGGQRQRIGIARALYKQAPVLVLDEATSALDQETESAVIDSLGKLEKIVTILIIAHRLSTLSKCQQVIRLGDE